MRDLGMLEDLTQSDVLADLGMTQAVKREAECRQVLLIADWARLNDAEHFHPDTAVDGSERLVRLGGEGTPRVAEFAPAAVGLQLGVSPHTASMRMAEALDLRFRLPRCWQAVAAFRARADYARLLARKTRELPADQAGFVDEQVVQFVDGRVGWSKFEQLIEVAIRRCDPEAARAREEAARARQFVKKTRPHDGMQGLFMWAEAPITAVVFARIRFFAQVLDDLGDPDPVDARMVKAMLLLAHPAQALKVLERHHRAKTRAGFDSLAGARGSTNESTDDDPRNPTGPKGPDGPEGPVLDYEKLLPTVLLFVHMYFGPAAGVSTGSTNPDGSTDDTGVVRVEGHGPVTREWVRGVLGERARFRIQPVLDLAGMAPVEGYEIPDRHRKGVQLLTPADIYPFAGDSSRMQIDHTQEWCPVCSKEAAAGPSTLRQAQDGAGSGTDQDARVSTGSTNLSSCGCGGYSGIGNYGPMGQRNHRIKTFRKDELDVKQPWPGIYLWRDATGQIYLRDCTGTRTVPAPAPAARPRPLVVELYRPEAQVVLAA